MKINSWKIALPIMAAVIAAAPLAGAVTGMFATETEAQTSCAADEVVWVDLDRGRYYHKAQPDFAKSKNGGYTCLKVAHAQYREAHG